MTATRRSLSSGISGRGYYVPAGSLDVWKAARNNANNELVEIVIFGDSTTSGSCYDPPANSNSIYSWTQRLRARILAAGFKDGGRGIVATNEIAPGMNPDGITAISAVTGFASSDNNGALLTDSFKSVAGADAFTVSGKGTAIRLLITKLAAAGGFTYSIDGGAAVTVESTFNGFTGDAILAASGLTEGTHTCRIVNLGGSLFGPPTITDAGTGGFGTGENPNLTTGQAYDYVITTVTASGETVASNVITKTESFTTPNRVSLLLNIANNGAQSYNVYRRNSGVGVYGRLQTAVAPVGGAGATSGFTAITDNGSAAPNAGVNPPSTSTAGRNATNSTVQLVPAFIRATGIVIHKAGISGISSSSYFSSQNPNLGNYPAQLLVGVTPGVPSSGGAQYGWAQPEAAHPAFPRCRLVIWALGINDQQGSVSQATATAAAALQLDNMAIWARMARSAGADPLVVIPHYSLAANNHVYAGEFITATAAGAKAMSLPIVDFNEAIGPAGLYPSSIGVAAVHATQATYNLEADFLWDRVLSR